MTIRVARSVALFLAGLLVALAMGLISARIAVADPVVASADRVVELRRSEGSLLRLSAERRSLEQKLAAQSASIESLKRQGGNSNTDELGRLLSSSQELARTLAALSGRARALEVTIATQRRAVLESIDAELAQPQTEARRNELLALRRDTAARAAASAAPVSIAQPRVGKLDDPADLAEKAAVLAASERKLRAQAGVLSRRAAGMDKRLRLRRASERASSGDLFADDAPRRRSATAGDRKTGGAVNAGNESNDDARSPGVQSPAEVTDGFAATPPGGSPAPAQTNGDPIASGGQPAPQGVASPLPATRSPRDADLDLAGDPSVILVDVLDPATLAELRSAQRTGDPARQIQALRRAEASLRVLADELARRQAAMKKRAAELRKQK